MDSIEGMKYLWQVPQVSKDIVIDFARKFNFSYPVIETLLNRGCESEEALNRFFFSSFERDVSHSSLLKDAQKSVDRILLAIKKQEKILICGDYDVDGITSSAMMMLCLVPLGTKINYFLPHRVRDGYGISSKIIKKAAKSKYDLIITVDNGITAFEAGKEAKKSNIDLIITDHHRPHKKLPLAYAIVNPHQPECFYPYKQLAGVGVTFKLLDLLYESLGKKLPERVYELLLLGTIADVVPLTGENRFWVRYGLNLLNNFESLPLRVLKKNARLNKPIISSGDIGYFLAPQINALGRLEDARQGVRFLVGADEQEVEHVGSVLKELNESRKNIERTIFSQVEEAIERKEVDLESERVIVFSSRDWQPGVIGLVASRVVGSYNRPAFLFHETSEGILKGSCRSVSELNIFEVLQENSDILLSFGGHAQAAGLSLSSDKLKELKERLEVTIANKMPIIPAKASIKLDAGISLSDVNKKLLSDMNYMEPFGNENNKPLFCLKNVTLVGDPLIFKDMHTKCMVFEDGIIKPVIFFNRPDIYEVLLSKKDDSLSLAVSVMENYFNGQLSVELQGIDVAL